MPLNARKNALYSKEPFFMGIEMWQIQFYQIGWFFCIQIWNFFSSVSEFCHCRFQTLFNNLNFPLFFALSFKYILHTVHSTIIILHTPMAHFSPKHHSLFLFILLSFFLSVEMKTISLMNFVFTVRTSKRRILNNIKSHFFFACDERHNGRDDDPLLLSIADYYSSVCKTVDGILFTF